MEIAAQVEQRYGGLLDRVALYAPYRHDPHPSAETIDPLSALPA
jgi:hypothetical protein